MKPIPLLLPVVLILLVSAAAHGQTRPVRPVEAELALGITCATARYDAIYDHNAAGPTGLAEVRYNFARLPLDVGFQVRGSRFRRHYADGYHNNFGSCNLLLTADYNLFRTRPASLFAGLGAGCLLQGFTNVDTDDPLHLKPFSNSSPISPCLMPRIGVEFWHRLRLTCSYTIELRTHNNFSLTAGFVFGGGTRR